MKRLLLQLFAISSVLLLAAGAYGGSRPRYGGTVRILLHDRVLSIDPLGDEDRPAARDRMAALAFENLTASGRARAFASGACGVMACGPGKTRMAISAQAGEFP